jgi:enoyl-[acyl-carrier protein] reductase III
VSETLFSLDRRNILVTGGTRGIGKAISVQFAEAGAAVLANFVRAQDSAKELSAYAQQMNLPIRICRADLTSAAGMTVIEEAVSEMSGGLHGLVYCAATGVHKPFEELSLRHYDWTFALNTRAFFDLVKRLLPFFASEASVVAVSSQGAVRAVPAYSVIGASKGALEALARHLAVELAPRGVRVNILAPGAVATQAWDVMPDAANRMEELAARTPIGRLTTPEEIALVAQFLCSDASRAMIGQTVVVDGGAGIPI